MFFNPRSLLKLAFITVFILEANAVDLKPVGTGHHPGVISGHPIRRAPAPVNLDPIKTPDDVHANLRAKRALPAHELEAISDPGILLRGRSEKREMPGNGCFDPAKYSTFYWGGYGMYGQSMYVQN